MLSRLLRKLRLRPRYTRDEPYSDPQMVHETRGPFTFDLDDAHYAAIGRVSNEWALFEFFIDLTIWHLIDPNDDGRLACITAQLATISRRIDALASIVALRGGDDYLLKAINRFAEKSIRMAECEIALLHVILGKAGADGQALQTTNLCREAIGLRA